MAKAKSNSRTKRATSTTKVTKSKASGARSNLSAVKGETAQPAKAPCANTKQDSVLALLRSPSGATIDTMVKVTGWQQHSVRGFLAGVVRKKLGLNLVSEAGDGGRVYRVKGQQSSKATAAV